MEILRYAAFTDDPSGGNPAGVVLDATGLAAAVGPIAVDTAGGSATLRTVAPATREIPGGRQEQLLKTLRYTRKDLDPGLPLRAAYAGAWHPIVALANRGRLAGLDYDEAALGALMAEQGWTTIDLVWRESATVFHARNPFPPGGVYEDPATGAAAGAFGGYLRELGLVEVPAELTVRQGDDMGRPSLVRVGLSADPASGVAVTGRAVEIPAG
jgi:PhzF family phenazine biosynthesis protein